jgi:hypothetical protein
MEKIEAGRPFVKVGVERLTRELAALPPGHPCVAVSRRSARVEHDSRST